MISAGFDSRKDDPLGQFTLTDDDFAFDVEQIEDASDGRAG